MSAAEAESSVPVASTSTSTSTSTEVKQGPVPIQLDVGFLATVDPSAPDLAKLAAAPEKRDSYLRACARNATQALLNAVFTLPYTMHAEYGPLATLPAILPADRVCEPREKPLPKQGGKPLTKWEKFAREKGISHSKKDRKVWDDEKKEWVNRWGFRGANKDAEEQWLHEVPANADPDFNPRTAAKKERKERKATNEKKRLKNIERAQASASAAAQEETDKSKRLAAREAHKRHLEGDLLRSKRATASLGKFDRQLPGDDARAKGVKRKFAPNEKSSATERAAQLAVLGRLDRKAAKAAPELNVRKAIKSASGGHGTAALAEKSEGGPPKKSRR